MVESLQKKSAVSHCMQPIYSCFHSFLFLQIFIQDNVHLLARSTSLASATAHQHVLMSSHLVTQLLVLILGVNAQMVKCLTQ